METEQATIKADVILIGGGIMSATLGALLKQLDPGITIALFEKLDAVAEESSAAWNNAGTGHSALCELNYTPEKEDGTIDISKALHITESFEISKQFWSYLLENGCLTRPQSFIHSVPHMSFVTGGKDVAYLQKRYEAMKAHHFYERMEYSADKAVLGNWAPLIMAGRNAGEHVAATKIDIGTDVNFGELTRCLCEYLSGLEGVGLHMNHEVTNLEQAGGNWHLRVKDHAAGGHKNAQAKFVFIGAGGDALLLLEKAGIPESKGFGGFPVSGQWLKCTNEAIVAQHHAKVYGKASVGAPPMSVPHLDSRIIDGKKELLFGPYAGFSTKFLKQGSFLDLPRSVTRANIMPMIETGLHNAPLVKYLVEQVLQSWNDRMKELRAFFPEAKVEDWELRVAGQRVQVIKRDEKEGGVLEFGTEVVRHADGSLAALLGASPGASTSVNIMLGLIKNCFGKQVQTGEWLAKLQQMIPSYGKSLADDAALCAQVRKRSAQVLGLNNAG